MSALGLGLSLPSWGQCYRDAHTVCFFSTFLSTVTPLSLLTTLPTSPYPVLHCVQFVCQSACCHLLLFLRILLLLLWPWSNRFRELKSRQRCRSSPLSLFLPALSLQHAHLVADPRTCPCSYLPLSPPLRLLALSRISLCLLHFAAICAWLRLRLRPWSTLTGSVSVSHLHSTLCLCVRASVCESVYICVHLHQK